MKGEECGFTKKIRRKIQITASTLALKQDLPTFFYHQVFIGYLKI